MTPADNKTGYSKENSEKVTTTTVKFSLRDDNEPNITSYSAATIMNSMSTEADTATDSDVVGTRPRRRRTKRDSIVVSTDPSQHVMFLLGENDGDPNQSNSHKIFCELDELYDSTGVGDFEWKESARWIKFEEDVEENGERWSKPHVATLSLFSLFQVRNFLDHATILLNLEAQNMTDIATILVEQFIVENKLDAKHRDRTIELLLKRHTHLHDKLKHKIGRSGTQTGLPLIRSLADIGKRNSSRDMDRAHQIPPRHVSESQKPGGPSSRPSFILGLSLGSDLNGNQDNEASSTIGNFDYHFMKKIPPGAETSNVLVGETDYLSQAIVAFIRLQEAVVLGEMTEVPVPSRFLFILLGAAGNGHSYRETGRSMATLMSDEVFHEVAYKAKNKQDILAGVDEFLSSSTVLPPGEWDPSIRIEPPASVPSQENRKVSHVNGPNASHLNLGDASKLPNLQEYEIYGQNNATGPDSKAANMVDGADKKMLTSLDNMHAQTGGIGGSGGPGSDPPQYPGNGALGGDVSGGQEHGHDPTLVRTGKFCGGLIADIKRKIPWYGSDFKDALNVQCFGSFFFLYFACLTPIITFGGLLSQETGGYLGTIESILSGAVVGILYALFSGQPLTIQGSTGPVLVFEKIVYTMCKGFGWYYLSFRLWIGIWIAILLLIMVASDMSALIKYITRFTEESFATLIACIFIIKAIEKLIDVRAYAMVDRHWSPALGNISICKCSRSVNVSSDAEILNSLSQPIRIPRVDNSTIDWKAISDNRYTWKGYQAVKDCALAKGVWSGGDKCDTFYVPDVLFFSALLFIATFFIAYSLKKIKNGPFFPSRVRSIISDFAVMIAILLCTLMDYLLGLHTPKLNVPHDFKPTNPDRGWLIPFFKHNPWWTSLVALGPALLGTILIFMDQQITAVIVNRKENKLIKGSGYHLDLLIVALTIIVNSFIGIPWFVAATVLSLNHVMSLQKQSEANAPGEKPVFLGCREQRVTGFFIFLFIGLSVFMTPLLKHIPMPVLYGIFLLMGISSLNGVQFVDRFLLLFMPVKHQPDYTYLRHVRARRVHMFTAIQVTCFALLWVIKEVKEISIMFPLMVLAMCFIRKLLDFIFTQEELEWLDDLLPGSKGKMLRKGTEIELSFSKMNPVPSMEKKINITEEVSKTMIWRNLSGTHLSEQNEKKKSKKRESKNANKKLKIGDQDSDADDEALLTKAASGVEDVPVKFMLYDQEIKTSKSGAGKDHSSPSKIANLNTPQITVNPPSGRSSPTFKKDV